MQRPSPGPLPAYNNKEGAEKRRGGIQFSFLTEGAGEMKVSYMAGTLTGESKTRGNLAKLSCNRN